MASKSKGLNAHRKRLKALASPAMMREIEKALFAGGQLIESEAKLSISTGSASGQSGGKHQHVRSAPGQPPNYETGVLSDNIETAKAGVLRVTVSSNARYAAPLEFGTSKMAARPYMRPARDKQRPAVKALVEDAMNRIVKRSRSSD